MNKIKAKNEKGVTLIALAITIIVLIILAGIIINATMGDNGIVNKTQSVVANFENSKDDANTEEQDFINQLNSK